jgi:arabinan endo-1,5-alpha-L-arabinosidase
MVKNPLAAVTRLALMFGCAIVSQVAATSAYGQVGDVQNVHDPVIIKAGDSFYVFCTGPGIPVRQSSDLYTWHNLGPAFKEPPKWAADEFRGARAPWAPDISFFNGTYHLYYAISQFGRNRSVIGLATSKNLDPQNPDFGWTDRGLVIETHQGDDWNAIDPNLVLDENGDPWLVAGSFWTGIKMRRLDRDTGLPSDSDTKLYSLASRQQSPRAIEGPFIIRHGEFYYLFVSFDQCCRGVNSTYKTLVGRSKSITGPFEDRDHRSMMKGGATLVLQSQGRVRGPGHCAVLSLDGQDWLVHHFYDGENNGQKTLQIRPIIWDDDGWPLAGEPIAGPLGSKVDEKKIDLTGTWLHSLDFGEESKIDIQTDGRVAAPSIDGITWKVDGRRLTLNWPAAGDQKASTENCYLADDGTWFVGRDTSGKIVRGRKAPPEKKSTE